MTFEKSKIATIWAAAEDAGVIDVAAAAKALSASQKEALETLAADALADAKISASPWTSHFMDLAIIGLLAGVAIFLWFAYRRFPTANRPARVTIADPNGMKILQVIAPSDVEIKPSTDVQGSFETLDQVIGRYVVKPMKKDQVVTASDVSSSPLPKDLAGRTQILLPLHAGVLGNNLSLPDVVSVIATPHCEQTQAKPLVLDDLYLMAFDGPSNSAAAVMAVKSEQLAVLVPMLGCAEFTLAKQFQAPK